MIDVDFSLALINRTGAFHVGRDLITGAKDLIGSVRYWRLHRSSPPFGLPGKLLGRAMLAELRLGRTEGPLAWPRRDAARPMLFLDPLYVLRARLSPADIVLCHDVGPVTHPDLFTPSTTADYKAAYAKIAETKPGMAFVSEASATEFAALYGADYPMFEAIPLGLRPGFAQTNLTRPDGIDGPFLLIVAALERRKNHLRLFDAFRKAGLAARGWKLVVVGPRGLDALEIEAAAASTDGVLRLGYVTDPELRWLFANAHGFALPSLLEGFGAPALEAAAHGLPALLSGGGALEEAVASAGLFCDPLDVNSIAEGLLALVDLAPERRAAIVAQATARAGELTIERFQSRWRDLIERRISAA